MSQEELRAALGRLRQEVKNLALKDPQSATRINQLIAEIDRQAKTAGDEQDKAALLEALPKVIEQLEVEHPTLTAVLSRIITTLSSMGI